MLGCYSGASKNRTDAVPLPSCDTAITTVVPLIITEDTVFAKPPNDSLPVETTIESMFVFII